METSSGGARRVVPLAEYDARRRWRGLDPDIRRVVAIVAADAAIAPELMLQRTRGRAGLARARQVAMYLSHVCLGRQLTAVARAFGRDPSTTTYACAKIEDLRDDPRFDARLSALEARIESTGSAGHPAAEHVDAAR